MKIPIIKENPDDKSFVTIEELFIETKKNFKSIAEQVEEHNKIISEKNEELENLMNVANTLKDEFTTKISKLEEALKGINTVIEGYSNKFEQTKTSIDNVKKSLKKDINKIAKNFESINIEKSENEIKKVNTALEELKTYFKAELKRVEDKHVVKMDTQPKRIYGLSNVTAPSMIEKTITPGTIRYDKDTDTYRVCKKSGWETLKL